ncbi:OLC1v1033330C1 [Oldenlandia corymbosa var. corymbosa]|uniref:OLC1v1033330C1 n=1 Tax=Oldenlandia corymbosa var. corymbosa TaxID=529605 RepID=A0AAV1CPT2_OLDCO|nr:OLC1v1033330C1 [Oldenlandia corymbosa var. corymbosa]
MCFLVAVWKWFLGMEDDDGDREISYGGQRSSYESTIRPHTSSQYAYHVLDGGCKFETSSRLNSAQKTSSYRADSIFFLYPGLTKSVNAAASNLIQSSTTLPFPSQTPTSFSPTNESGKSASAGKTKNPFSSSPPLKNPPSPKGAKPPPVSTKRTISLEASSSSSPKSKNTYVWIEKDASSTYVFPKEIKSLIERDIVPGFLKMPLSKSSYKDYFHALLYAEDCYLEKWDGFEMKNMKVELHEAAIYARKGKQRNINKDDDSDEKLFVAFELDKIRERRPFLISRDFVSLQPLNWKGKTFQGVIYRVVKSNLVLAEFGEDFYCFHHLDNKYDVKFSFNRVCLKRAHQAIGAASKSIFGGLLFPNPTPNRELPFAETFPRYKPQQEVLAIRQILRLRGAPPYLVEGPLVTKGDGLSKTGVLAVEAILQILRADPSKRILVCSPVNKTCDLLMIGLKKKGISESDMFRANAAFREVDGVPLDILPSCLYEDDAGCFTCPSLKELKKYKVILTTFMSSYRLYGEGITAGHFSHIFLADASSSTEPEAMVPLANFITNETNVVVTGAPRNHSGWIRSKIARENGLMTSYFERLRDISMYKELDPKYIVQLEDAETKDRNDIW